ncbi:MAG: hypothetical protein QXU60_06175 [Sulfolobales archaeon]
MISVQTTYSMLVEDLESFIENSEDMYQALEEMKLSGVNTLYILLVVVGEDEDRNNLVLFVNLNPYTEDVYSAGVMIPVGCDSESSSRISIDEIRDLALRIGGYVISFHNCTLIFRDIDIRESLREQITETFRRLLNRDVERVRIMHYAYDLLEEVGHISEMG